MEYKVSENFLTVLNGDFSDTFNEIFQVKKTNIEFYGTNLFDLSSFDFIFQPKSETIYSASYLQSVVTH